MSTTNENKELLKEYRQLLEEHKQWSDIFGRVIVEALQNSYEYLNLIKRNTKIEFSTGCPKLKSESIRRSNYAKTRL